MCTMCTKVALLSISLWNAKLELDCLVWIRAKGKSKGGIQYVFSAGHPMARRNTQKRNDDTALIVAEMAKWGYDSERGREELRRMNHAHSRFDISNDDYLHVLSTFIYEPVRWMDRFRSSILSPSLWDSAQRLRSTRTIGGGEP